MPKALRCSTFCLVALFVFAALSPAVPAGSKWRMETARAIRNSGWHHGGYTIVARVTLPEDLDLNLETSDGDVSVESVRGNLELRTSDGDVSIGDVDGEEARISSSDGDINIDNMAASTVRIATSDGDVRVKTLDGQRVEMRTSDGDIRVDRASGSLKASTGDGDITVGIDRFDEMTLETGDGDIEIDGGTFGADLDLRGEEVVLRNAGAFDGQKNESMARGSLNGGGPRLQASTRDGSIVVR
jgi:DUF4097 and DUF4098 domain-containing protein YvlB